MPRKAPQPPHPTPEPGPGLRARILAAARSRFFTYGYSALTLDELAADLGISKKTFYVHFPGKDALVEAILAEFVQGVRALAEDLFTDPALSFTVKLHRFTESMVRRFERMNPHVFRDLQRAAPHLYRRIEELRHNNIPLIFGRLLRQGQAAGIVRADVDPDFAVEFWRPAIQSLMHPDTLERLKRTPDQVFAQAADLFFSGLLTPTGRKEHEKNLPA